MASTAGDRDDGAAGAPGAAAPRSAPALAVSLLALGTVAALLLLRSWDDNRLVSWRWAFAGVHPARLYLPLAAGIALANLAARARLPPRRPALVLFVAAYAVGASFWSEPEVIVDASRYFTQAKYLELHGLRQFVAQWGRDVAAWTDLPLVPLLYGLAFRLVGESRVAIQALTTLLFAGSVALTCRIGAALWDEDLGFLAGALVLGAPYLLTQVPSMLVDVPTMAFLALAVLAAVRAFERGGPRRIVVASVAVWLACLTKYSTWLLLSVVPVIGLAQRRRGAAAVLRTGAAVALLSAALLAAALACARETHARQIALLLEYQAPGLRRWGESFASTVLFQVHPFVTAAALASAGVAARRRDARWLVAAWPVLLLAALRVERARYWIPALPMVALLAAYGLQAIRAREARHLVAGCAVASSLVVAWVGYLPFLERTSLANLASAGRFLDSLPERRVEVLTPPQADAEVNPAVAVPLLDLYTR